MRRRVPRTTSSVSTRPRYFSSHGAESGFVTSRTGADSTLKRVRTAAASFTVAVDGIVTMLSGAGNSEMGSAESTALMSRLPENRAAAL
jgi:hypothetical protein